MPDKKNIERTSISDAQLKDEFIKLFEAGNTDKGKCKEVLRSKYKLQEQRYYKSYAAALQGWQKLKEKAQIEQIHTNTAEALKSGLKSKTERISDIQSQIQELKQKLSDNKDFKYMVINGRVQKVVCEVDLSTRAYIHKTIKDLESEINKMEGNYAPTKVAQTDSAGNDTSTHTTIIIENPHNNKAQ
jgi:hypothetical protein